MYKQTPALTEFIQACLPVIRSTVGRVQWTPNSTQTNQIKTLTSCNPLQSPPSHSQPIRGQVTLTSANQTAGVRVQANGWLPCLGRHLSLVNLISSLQRLCLSGHKKEACIVLRIREFIRKPDLPGRRVWCQITQNRITANVFNNQHSQTSFLCLINISIYNDMECRDRTKRPKLWIFCLDIGDSNLELYNKIVQILGKISTILKILKVLDSDFFCFLCVTVLVNLELATNVKIHKSFQIFQLLRVTWIIGKIFIMYFIKKDNL